MVQPTQPCPSRYCQGGGRNGSVRPSDTTIDVCSVSYTLVMSLPDLTPRRSFWLGRNQFTIRCSATYRSVQEIDLLVTVMPVIPNERADDGVVLLFHMRVVVPLVWMGTAHHRYRNAGRGRAPATYGASSRTLLMSRCAVLHLNCELL